jgi:hypothetical protein
MICARRLFAPAMLEISILLVSCSAPRPQNAPADAVKVIAPKGTGPWQSCKLTQEGQVHCWMYNDRGEVLYDDIFVVYSGAQPRSGSDLRISSDGGEQWIRLENGTVLIPRTQRAEMTGFLDWLFGKRPTR